MMRTKRFTIRLIPVALGAMLSAIGLELFLVPHNMLVGGVTGASVLVSYVTEMRLGLFLFLLNIPFLLFRYRRLDAQTRLLTVVGLTILSFGAFLLHPAPPLMSHSLASASAGGLALGIGVGMMLRYGGMADMLNEMPRLADPQRAGRLGKMLMVFNGAVLLGGGLVFGWEEALYSIVAFLLAYRMTAFTLNGFSASRMLWIESERGEEIGQALRTGFGKEVIVLDNAEAAGRGKQMMLCTVHRLEQARVARDIRKLDPDCALAFYPVHR